MITLLFGSFAAFLILGVPVAVSMGLTAVTVLLTQSVPLVVIPQRMFAGTDSFPLVAVPFFILAGDLLAQGKVSEKLVQFADAILGFLRGGLWVVAVLASMFFAAISGSGAATTAAVGTPLIPELEKKKYNPATSAALIAAGGCIGVVIPPSVPMILYAVIADQSVARLFLNGFIPGVLMGLVLIIIALSKAYRNNYEQGSPFSFRHIGRTFKEAVWGLLTPLIILGGIFSGYFTPSEAAVIAVDYALLVAVFIYRDMGWRDIFRIFTKSAVTMSVVMFLIATASALSWILANWQIPGLIARNILALSSNKFIILLLINIVILIAGVFMETASALIILTPVFLPLVNQLGVDLIHFGLLVVIGLAIGMITPPVAINLYVASTISNIPIERISKAVVPLMLGLVLALLLITYIPLYFDIIF
ncbi:MAG: TRAP transporter large permease [Peptococcaceae bacterium]|jgi:C4-dicarboxylate transporter DctM subunit|nr:TRAP transporter large permease [Peptococcaceae bacterium]MDH7524996.1 TRAP transporter large permease [Peptococcaceae bacterium]